MAANNPLSVRVSRSRLGEVLTTDLPHFTGQLVIEWNSFEPPELEAIGTIVWRDRNGRNQQQPK